MMKPSHAGPGIAGGPGRPGADAERRTRPAPRPPLWIGVLLAMSLVLPSCGRTGRQPVYRVRGQVLDAQGKPAAGALVVFHPADTSDAQAARPLAYVDPQGVFELTTYERGDGAPAGDYVVTVEWREETPTPFGPKKEGPDRLRGRHSDPKTSKLRATVGNQEQNEVPAIRLQ